MHDGAQLLVRVLPGGLALGGHLVQVLGGADARHHVLALGVDQVLAHRLVFARRAVAREGYAGARGLAHVAVHHGADVDRRAEQTGHLVDGDIFAGALGVPGAEHRVDGELQLLDGILGKRLADLLEVDALVDFAQFLEVFGREIGVFLGPVLGLDLRDLHFEVVVGQPGGGAHDHVAEHVEEASVAVPARARVVRLLNEAEHRLVVHAEVEDGVHHAGHGDGRAGAHGNQKRILRVAQLLAHQLLELGQLRQHLVPHAGRIGILVLAVVRAGLGGHREARRHRQAGQRHVGQVRTLAAQDGLHAGIAFGVLLAETVEINVLLLARAGLGCFGHKNSLYR